MGDAPESTQPPSTAGVVALKPPARLKPRKGDPLLYCGRHFGRTVHAMCNIPALITNGILRMGEERDEESMTDMEQREERVFRALLGMVPNFSDRLLEGSEEEAMSAAQLIQKGVSSARSDDTKSLKGAVVDWITPRNVPLNPPLARNVKANRGFHYTATGALLCPAGLNWQDSAVRESLASGTLAVSGDQWPLLVYANQEYDVNEPWKGLFRSQLLVWAYKHIFTSPSSVESEVKATRSGNACLHGMTQVTKASIAYIATQLRFSLTSANVFCRTDTTTDSERFYESILEFLDDPEEKEEVGALLDWWNVQVFPSHVRRGREVTKQSALARLKERRAAKLAQRAALGTVSPNIGH
ncbi:hypothetical protein BD410DRAFT_858948 [Rickenella mellea]|uniref:Uncharacterized protein n=1 Tax=Rickenella mellea TaxID=50990 RepID=A0A4Y7PIG4_9AGAM|nr:hypothetical protein BD410DRAFT_858948 [Rickenella mellea]